MLHKDEENLNLSRNATTARSLGILPSIVIRNSVIMQEGYIIKDYLVRPQNHQTRAFHSNVQFTLVGDRNSVSNSSTHTQQMN